MDASNVEVDFSLVLDEESERVLSKFTNAFQIPTSDRLAVYRDLGATFVVADLREYSESGRVKAFELGQYRTFTEAVEELVRKHPDMDNSFTVCLFRCIPLTDHPYAGSVPTLKSELERQLRSPLFFKVG